MFIDLSGPVLARFKSDARTYRAEKAAAGTPVSQAQALEAIAHRNGARDWNTLHARATRKVRLTVGDRVTGRYLGQPITALVQATAATPNQDKLRLTLRFDTPVDVVTFDSFSSFRRRVSALIGTDGRTTEVTSDGTPHLELTGWSAEATATAGAH